MINLQPLVGKSVSIKFNGEEKLSNGKLGYDDNNNWYIDFTMRMTDKKRRLYFEPEFIITIREHDEIVTDD